MPTGAVKSARALGRVHKILVRWYISGLANTIHWRRAVKHMEAHTRAGMPHVINIAAFQLVPEKGDGDGGHDGLGEREEDSEGREAQDEGAFVEDSVHVGGTDNLFGSVTCGNDVDVRVQQCFTMSVPTPPNIH